MATMYIVLRREGGHTEDSAPEDGTPAETREIPESWLVVGEPIEATTDLAAIKAVAKATQMDLSRGAVAVPARSWRPRKAEVRREERTLWT